MAKTNWPRIVTPNQKRAAARKRASAEVVRSQRSVQTAVLISRRPFGEIESGWMSQIGPRARRRRTAAKRKAVAKARPIQRLGVARNRPGVSWARESSDPLGPKAKAAAVPPLRR